MARSKEQWYEESFQTWRESVKVFQGLKVSIARKAPRLYEYEVKSGKLERSVLDGLISEHALPFVLPELDEEAIALIDDAIYYGTTYENVLSGILTAQALFHPEKEPVPIRSLPVVCAEKVKKNRFADFKDIPRVPDDYIPYYINRLTTSFFVLGKPFDVEYPIVYFHKTVGLGAGTADGENGPDGRMSASETFVKVLKEIFPGHVYIIAHQDYPDALKKDDAGNTGEDTCRIMYNYTILVSPTFRDDESNTEFAKFRLYDTPHYLCVAAFAPRVLAEEDFVDNLAFFEHTPFDRLWRNAIGRMKKPEDQEYEENYKRFLVYENKEEIVNQIHWDSQKREYSLLRKRSQVVWANYLYSFSFLLEYKSKWDQLAGKYGLSGAARLEQMDLQLLLGPVLGADAADELEWIYRSAGMDLQPLRSPAVDPEFITNCLIQDFIPEKYKEEYNQKNQQAWKECRNLPEALSALFANQHFYIEKRSRNREPDTFERLRFGVSYDSLQKEFQGKFGKEADFLFRLHAWNDKKIDQGSVVPKYDRITYNQKRYWHRLFRAGENDDRIYGQLSRVALFLFSYISGKLSVRDIPRVMVENVFSLVFGNKLQTIDWEKAGFVFDRPEWSGEYYFISFFNDGYSEEAVATPLVDYLLRMGILYENREEKKVSIGYSDFVQELSDGNILDTSIEDLLKKEIDVVVALWSKTDLTANVGLMNKFFIRACEPYEWELAAWKEVYGKPLLARMEKSGGFPSMEMEGILLAAFRDAQQALLELFYRSYTLSEEDSGKALAALADLEKRDKSECLESIAAAVKKELARDEASESYNKDLWMTFLGTELIQAVYIYRNDSYILYTLRLMEGRDSMRLRAASAEKRLDRASWPDIALFNLVKKLFDSSYENKHFPNFNAINKGLSR